MFRIEKVGDRYWSYIGEDLDILFGSYSGLEIAIERMFRYCNIEDI